MVHLLTKMVPELIEEWLLNEPPGTTKADRTRRSKHRASGPAGWRAAGPAQTVNVLAHLLYGLSVQLAAREVWTNAQRQRPPRVG